MEEQLRKLLQLIDDHFNEVVWKLRPPIKDIDFKLLILATKIIELKNSLKDIKDIDIVIGEIMTFMEQEFQIPMLGINLPLWLEKDKVRHPLVIQIYNQLSDLRVL